MVITDDTPHYRVPGLCYPQDIWYEVDHETGNVGWYGVGFNAAQDVFRLIGRDKTPVVVTQYNSDIVSAVADGTIDLAPLEMGFSHERHLVVDFGPSMAFSRLFSGAKIMMIFYLCM